MEKKGKGDKRMIYDTLLIGCGFLSAGYATEKKNTCIVEEHQMCDSAFTLTVPSFCYSPYVPKTIEGERLFEIFRSLSLFSEKQQNTSAFECALSKYLLAEDIRPTLKCRVIEQKKREDGLFEVSVQTNGGLDTLFARKVIDTTPHIVNKQMTVLFVSEDYEDVSGTLSTLFPDSSSECAFYDGRYAVHIPIPDEYDENTAKVYIYKKWNEAGLRAKILYIAPLFYGVVSVDALSDLRFKNPIEAFEYGIAMAKEEE